MKKNVEKTTLPGKCKSCSGELKFNPSTESLACSSCGSVVDLEKSRDVVRHDATLGAKGISHQSVDKQIVKCSSCGASVDANVQQCTYCGSTVLGREVEKMSSIKIDGIIPFQFDSKEAVTKFSQNVKKKFFVPKDFKNQLPQDTFKGVYIPAVAFNADSHSTYKGYIEEGVGENATRRRISGEINWNHRDVLVEASKQISNEDLSSIDTYDVSMAYKYDDGFVRGYYAEPLNESLEVCQKVAREKFAEEVEEAIAERYDTHNDIDDLSLDTTYSNEQYSTYLLPVYNYEYTYKNKKRRALVNGQTGSVGGNLPVSALKVGLVIGLGALALLGTILFFMSLARGAL